MPRSDRSRAGSLSAAAQLALDVAGGTIATTLVAELTGWLDEPRFRAFVEANRAKVRRKFRDARTAERLPRRPFIVDMTRTGTSRKADL